MVSPIHEIHSRFFAAGAAAGGLRVWTTALVSLLARGGADRTANMTIASGCGGRYYLRGEYGGYLKRNLCQLLMFNLGDSVNRGVQSGVERIRESTPVTVLGSAVRQQQSALASNRDHGPAAADL